MTHSLTDELSELDKKRIKNYILKYGGITNPDKKIEIGEDPNYVDKWLSNWAKNKKKLFRLFGNSFIISKKVQVENSIEFLYKSYDSLYDELDKMHKNEKEKTFEGKPVLHSNFLSFIDSTPFFREIINMKVYKYEKGVKIPFIEYSLEDYDEKISWHRYEVNGKIEDVFFSCFRKWNWLNGERSNSEDKEQRFRRDLPNGRYKELRIIKGEKNEKLQKKILDFFDFKENHPYFYEQYLYLDKKIQELKSQKSHSAILCLSIHPLDFMTMSDNDNHWTSCMNWTSDCDGGCYRIGTVEMMNSDVAICTYLLSDNKAKQTWNFGIYDKTFWNERDFYYPDIDPNSEDIEEWTWNNKTWRCLYYITKDILVSGKSYPYYNHSLNINILNIIKDMAKEKFNWDYQFGIQEYKDMKYSYYYTFENARKQNCNIIGITGEKKHNILFETRGMYNDFLLNKDFQGYYCYRNYVKKTKIISLSGIPLSIYNTKPFQRICEPNYNNSDEYADRYGETDSLF